MGFLTWLLGLVVTPIVNAVWSGIEKKLDTYFQQRSQISAISTEAGALKEELSNASSDAERIQILRKIGAFSERLGS